MKHLFLAALFSLSICLPTHAQTPPEKVKEFKQKIKHVVVIYEENWSFDGLYGKFPGADNIDSTMLHNKNYIQDSVPGIPYHYLPKPKIVINDKNQDDQRFTIPLENKPYDLNQFNITFADNTGDITHRFYTEQQQINAGKMNMFAALSENGGLTMSYFNTNNLPEAKLANDYTLCDHFFHSAFGGSFLNHQWLIAARSPIYENAPAALVARYDSTKHAMRDNVIDVDGKTAINTVLSANGPHPDKFSGPVLPSQQHSTIGDLLTQAHKEWAWYAGGWNDRLASKPDTGDFQYHHQPFVYFEKYKAECDKNFKGKRHLKDEDDFAEDIKKHDLPQVCFIKAIGEENEHPGYAELLKGQNHVKKLVDQIMNDKEYKDNTVIIITYDENGGRWDHVSPPPPADHWGPATRVPTIVISKYAKKHFIDKTPYETVSILKTIELLFDLKPLTDRDAKANDMLNALEFK